jgi:hypothetical protein
MIGVSGFHLQVQARLVEQGLLLSLVQQNRLSLVVLEQVVRDGLANVNEVNAVVTLLVVESITTLVKIVNQFTLEGDGGSGKASRRGTETEIVLPTNFFNNSASTLSSL